MFKNGKANILNFGYTQAVFISKVDISQIFKISLKVEYNKIIFQPLLKFSSNN